MHMDRRLMEILLVRRLVAAFYGAVIGAVKVAEPAG
jgi:hypothetical protein